MGKSIDWNVRGEGSNIIEEGVTDNSVEKRKKSDGGGEGSVTKNGDIINCFADEPHGTSHRRMGNHLSRPVKQKHGGCKVPKPKWEGNEVINLNFGVYQCAEGKVMMVLEVWSSKGERRRS